MPLSYLTKKLIPSLILVSLTGLLHGCGSSQAKAVAQCQDLVKERLRSPSSAVFGDTNIEFLDDITFEITGNFDAQNGFGAMIRGSFKCMSAKNDSNVRLIYVN